MEESNSNNLIVENIFDENGAIFQNVIEQLLIRYYNQHFD